MTRPVLSFLLTIAIASAVSACRNDLPETIPPAVPHDTATVPATSAVVDTLPSLSDTVHSATPGAIRPTALSPEIRTQLLRGAGQFISLIDSGNQEAFWGMLAERSHSLVERDRLTSADDVWKSARQTLGDIQGRRISVIGGTRDSASLLVEGLRMIDSERVDDPVIVHMLREGGAWKIMYPGLLYPRHHLRK